MTFLNEKSAAAIVAVNITLAKAIEDSIIPIAPLILDDFCVQRSVFGGSSPYAIIEQHRNGIRLAKTNGESLAHGPLSTNKDQVLAFLINTYWK